MPVDVSVATMHSEELIFRDGLGDRLLLRDTQGRPYQESLVLRTQLSSVPAFEFALNERLWLVERFDHPTFLTVRNIFSVPGPLPQITLITDYTGGVRLSETLSQAEWSRQPVTAGGALFVIKEILDGLAELHRQSGDLSHGALAPERIVLAGGRVRIADYVLGAAIEQLRYPTERYWKDLRVAVPPSAGGARLDRRVDVAQVGMIAVALFASRPLRDSEHIGALGELLTTTSLAPPIRNWLLRALHMDSRRVFLNAAEASQSLDEAMAEAHLRPAPGDLQLQSTKLAATASTVPFKPTPVLPKPAPPRPPGPKPPSPPAAAKATRDVWESHDTHPDAFVQRDFSVERPRQPWKPAFKRFLWAASLVIAMMAAFAAAQFVPAPGWLLSPTGTLVVESNPQGVEVLVNGKTQGVTPLTLKVDEGRHEVELRGPGNPKIFNVFVSRGDRVAQYVEFPQTRRR